MHVPVKEYVYATGSLKIISDYFFLPNADSSLLLL